jgi:hypothetical protein
MRRRRLLTRTVAVSLVAGLGAMAAPVAQAADPVTLLSEDFEDGDYAPLTQNGGPALSVVDADGDKALLVKGRTDDYDRCRPARPPPRRGSCSSRPTPGSATPR